MAWAKKVIWAAALAGLMLPLSALDQVVLAKKQVKKGAAQKASATSAKEMAICKSDQFVAGVDFYNKHNYKDAIANFDYVDTHGGCCQWTHYYLGLCYQGENQVGLAYRHFDWVISHGKDPSLRRYAQFGCDTVSYYAANRTYAGQGGIMGAVAMSRVSGGGGGGGGGGG